MTDTTAMRDELARVCGYEKRYGVWARLDRRPCHMDHPFPDGDLNALAAVWPSERQLVVTNRPNHGWSWEAFTEGDGEVGDTEYEARLRLTLAVLTAGEVGDED